MLLIKILDLIITYVNLVSTESTLCGNWTEFGEQKCIHIIDSEIVVNYENAIEMCTQTEKSHLITINSENEQKFIEKYLFKDKQIVDNIWIGLKNENRFKWSDKSSVDYTNWADKSPINSTDRPCVQMFSEDILEGKWVNENCNKKAVVVCQKTFDIKDLIQEIKNLRKELKSCHKVDPIGSENELISRIKQFHSHYYISKPFIDFDNKHKVLFTVWNNTYEEFKIDLSINLCKSLNSNIIEIRSKQKQEIFDKYIIEWNLNDIWFHLNGLRDSNGKWRWNSDGMEFNYTNWGENYPNSDLSNKFIYTGYFTTYKKSFWANWPDIGSFTICERELK